jgi:hypothetical protein
MSIYKSNKKGVYWYERDKRWNVWFRGKYSGSSKILDEAIKIRERLEIEDPLIKQKLCRYCECFFSGPRIFCSDECKEKSKVIYKFEQQFCLVCGKLTKFKNGTRGYGKFCSKKCNRSYVTSAERKVKSEKCKAYWNRLHANGAYSEICDKISLGWNKCVAIKGFFSPKHKNKYKGDIKRIIYRSSPELRYMFFLDDNPNVIEWSSEEIIIPYFDETKKRVRHYFPDFFVKIKEKDGTIKQLIIEYKPLSQTKLPNKPDKGLTQRQKNRYLKEAVIYVTNKCKWESAEKYAKAKGMEFVIITEKDLRLLT